VTSCVIGIISDFAGWNAISASVNASREIIVSDIGRQVSYDLDLATEEILQISLPDSWYVWSKVSKQTGGQVFSLRVFRYLRQKAFRNQKLYDLSIRFSADKKSIARNLFDENIENSIFARNLSDENIENSNFDFWFTTRKGGFFIRGISRLWAKNLTTFLKDYCEYIRTNKGTFISRLYGLHSTISNLDNKEMFFVIREDLFHPRYQPSLIFKIKGSQVDAESDKWSINFKLLMPSKQCHRLKGQLSKDADFLSKCKIVGYTLRVGVYCNKDKVLNNYLVGDVSIMPDGEVSKGISGLCYMGIVNIGKSLSKNEMRDSPQGICITEPERYKNLFLSRIDDILQSDEAYSAK